MMEENNDFFLAGGIVIRMEDYDYVSGDALVYLAGRMHKKHSTAFVWGHPFSTYVCVCVDILPL